MSWKYGIHMTENDAPSFNALVFETKIEARRAGTELLSRWLAPHHFSVHYTAEPETYTCEPGGRPEPIDAS